MIPQFVSLLELVESNVDVNSIAHPGVTILSRVHHDIGEAFVDPDRFDQVLTNLISNARQHGDTTFPIEVTEKRKAGQTVIEISNRLRERPTVAFERLIDALRAAH